MSTTYTSNLRLALPGTGENAGTWGDLVNNSITTLMDSALSQVTVAMPDANYTLTSNNGAADQSRAMRVVLTGTLTATRTLYCPTAQKLYYIANNTTQTILFQCTALGISRSLTTGQARVFWCDGTDIVEPFNYFGGTANNADNATAATNLASGSAGTIPYQSASGTTAMLAAGTSGQALLSNGAAAPSWGSPGSSMGAPQSIVMAPTTSGASTFLPATSGTLSITSQNVTSSAPLMVLGCVSGLNGTSVNTTRMGLSTANLTWPSLAASNTSYLYVDIAANGTLTTGSTISPPVYTQVTSPSTLNGVNTFVIPLMQMYAGNGVTATLVCRVFVGEVVTSGSGVTSSVAYNPGATFQTAQVSTLPPSGANWTNLHYLGIVPRVATFYAVCLTAEGNYAVGDIVLPYTSGTAGYVSPLTPTFTNKTVYWITGSNANPWRALNKLTGAEFLMTAANWAYYTTVQRGW